MNNFILAKEKELSEINSVGYLYRHVNSGAEFIFIKNDDANKVFSVAFKTFPEDDKGTAHVLEHCILCGSKNFPMKDVFSEISLSCLYTYLNAITFKDKTVYPLASLYESELIKLIKIYLDCVFNPLLRLETFLHEAWHYENLADNINANGVVYSEMKSSFSNPVRETREFLYKELFYNTCYKYESAGIPKKILKLKYDDMVLFYKKYYCPENCFLYLYGDIKDINYYLSLFDEYLENKKGKNKDFLVKKQEGFLNPVLKHGVYDYCGANKKYFGVGFVVGDILNFKLEMAFEILNSYLTKTVGAPLKKFLPLVKTFFESEIYQPVYNILSENFNGSLEKFRDTIMQIFSRINNKGLEKILLKSCINNLEFSIRTEFNKNRPKGLIINFLILKSWIYGGNVFDRISRLEILNELRREIDSGYFERLIDKYILNNNHAAFVCLSPNSKNKFEFAIEQNDIRNAMLMKKFINSEEKYLNLIELPDLSLIKEKDFDDIKECDEKNIFYVELDTQEIVYLNFVFKTNCVQEKDLCYIGLLREILVFVAIEKEHGKNMQEILNNLGNIKLNFETREDENKKFVPMLSLKIKLALNNLNQIIDMIRGIFLLKDFDEDSLIEKLIEQKLMVMTNNFINKPRFFVVKKVLSYELDEFKYHDFVDGLEFYNFIKKIIADFKDDKKKNDVKEKLFDVYKLIFKRENLCVNIACENKIFNLVYAEIKKLIKALDTNGKKNIFDKIMFKDENSICKYKFDFYEKNQAYFNLAKVNTNALLIFLKGFKINGASKVFESFMNKIYLMREIRINNGAYDAGCKFKDNAVCFYSCADMNIGLSYKKFLLAADFVLNFDFEHDKNNYLKKAIVNAINILDKPKGFAELANYVFMRYLAKKNIDQAKRIRHEILNTSENDLKDIARIIRNNLSTRKVCTLGNREKIYSEQEWFSKIIKL